MSWTAEKRAEADILRKLFPNLESTSGNEGWREQVVILTDAPPELNQEEAKAQLARGVKLLRGDHDEDDPFGMDEPEAIIRTADEPEAVEIDVIDVDAETGELLDGMRADAPDAPHPMRSGGPDWGSVSEPPMPGLDTEEKVDAYIADALPEPGPDNGDFDPEQPGDLLTRIAAQVGDFYQDTAALLDCIRTEEGDGDWFWPSPDDADAWQKAYTVALRYVHKMEA